VSQIIVQKQQAATTLNIVFSTEELRQSLQVAEKMTARQDSFESSWQQVHLARKWKE